MRKGILLLIIAGGIIANTFAQSGRRNRNPPPPPPPVPEPAAESLSTTKTPESYGPLMSLPRGLLSQPIESLDKGTFRLADFSDKVIVVNFWATWCGPCRREIPDYEKVRKQYSGQSVEFIGLTTEDPLTTRNRVEKFTREVNFGFRIGWADREIARFLMNGRGAIPQTFVLTPDGRVIDHWTGYSASQSGDHLRAAIERALSASTLPVKT